MDIFIRIRRLILPFSPRLDSKTLKSKSPRVKGKEATDYTIIHFSQA